MFGLWLFGVRLGLPKSLSGLEGRLPCGALFLWDLSTSRTVEHRDQSKFEGLPDQAVSWFGLRMLYCSNAQLVDNSQAQPETFSRVSC